MSDFELQVDDVANHLGAIQLLLGHLREAQWSHSIPTEVGISVSIAETAITKALHAVKSSE